MSRNKEIPLQILLEMRDEGASNSDIAAALGVNRRTVDRRFKRHDERQIGRQNTDGSIPGENVPGAGRQISRVSKQLDEHGNAKSFSVLETPIPEEGAFAHPLDITKRVSTLYGAEGDIRAQWQITTADETRYKEAFEQAMEAMKETLPRVPPMPLHTTTALSGKIHNLYVLSDAHIGALAWAPESGADWNLEIAEDMFTKALAAMINQSPPAATCTLVLLGDWEHYDKFEAVTTLSGHSLDAAGRQPQMNKVAIRIARKLLHMCLEAHEHVTLLVAEGNHDIIGSGWLRELFIAVYENETRLTIVDDPRPYYAIMIGDVMLCFHHGHLKGSKRIKGAEELAAIFADEYREMWGKASKVYIHTGHLHHPVEQYVRGAMVTQHPTLAARDAYAARHGFGGMREARSMTYHKRWGRCGTQNISPEMLDDL